MRIHLCTLFNYKYLDKGLVLFNSLKEVSTDFVLYVLAMDDKCFDILCEYRDTCLVPIRLSDFENEALIEAKSNRSFGEYCWTCSSSLIKYILDTYSPESCTYIDADMYFYSDPSVLIDEMNSKRASVLVVGHRFLKSLEKLHIKESGRFCVEFNTFKNDEKGRKLLDLWITQCLECCTHEYGKYCGDQKYLDNWCKDYDYVVETENLGAGVAPWNISQYKLVGSNNGIVLECRHHQYKLVFFHYEGMTYLSEHCVNINAFNHWGVDRDLVEKVYRPYLTRIRAIKVLLKEKYDIDYIMKYHPASTPKHLKFKDRIHNLYIRLKRNGGLTFLVVSRIPQMIYKKKNMMTV